jgi:hypothetical protein
MGGDLFPLSNFRGRAGEQGPLKPAGTADWSLESGGGEPGSHPVYMVNPTVHFSPLTGLEHELTTVSQDEPKHVFPFPIIAGYGGKGVMQFNLKGWRGSWAFVRRQKKDQFLQPTEIHLPTPFSKGSCNKH